MGNDTICVTIAVVNCNIMNTWNINDNEYDRSWGWSDTLCTSMTKLNAKAWIMKRCFFKKKAIPLLKKGQKMILDRGVTIPQCDVKHDYYAQWQCIPGIAKAHHHYSHDISNMHYCFLYSSNTLSAQENSLNHHAKGVHPNRFGESWAIH